MKRSAINPRGKHARGKELRDITPYLCERAGGMWCGWAAPIKCDGATCEYTGCHETEGLQRAHIAGRKSEKDDNIWNIITLCKAHHDKLDHGKAWEREMMREESKRIVRERNAEHGITEK